MGYYSVTEEFEKSENVSQTCYNQQCANGSKSKNNLQSNNQRRDRTWMGSSTVVV